MGKVIQVPSWFTKDNIDSFLESIINPDLTPVSKQIQFDLTSVRFIDPCGMTTLYNTCLWLENTEEVEATFLLNPLDKLPKYNEKPMMYLVDCGFFKEFFGNKEVYKVPMIRDTTLPVRTLRSEESYEWKETVLKPWLQKSCNKYCEFSNIQTAIDEIFNNIADHSSQNIGCVFAQFFPNLKKLKYQYLILGLGYRHQ